MIIVWVANLLQLKTNKTLTFKQTIVYTDAYTFTTNIMRTTYQVIYFLWELVFP